MVGRGQAKRSVPASWTAPPRPFSWHHSTTKRTMPRARRQRRPTSALMAASEAAVRPKRSARSTSHSTSTRASGSPRPRVSASSLKMRCSSGLASMPPPSPDPAAFRRTALPRTAGAASRSPVTPPGLIHNRTLMLPVEGGTIAATLPQGNLKNESGGASPFCEERGDGPWGRFMAFMAFRGISWHSWHSISPQQCHETKPPPPPGGRPRHQPTGRPT